MRSIDDLAAFQTNHWVMVSFIQPLGFHRRIRCLPSGKRKFLHSCFGSSACYTRKILPTIINILPLHGFHERRDEDKGQIGSSCRNVSDAVDDFRSVYKIHISERMDHVHENSKLDSFKFLIYESLFLKRSPAMTLYAPIRQFRSATKVDNCRSAEKPRQWLTTGATQSVPLAEDAYLTP